MPCGHTQLFTLQPVDKSSAIAIEINKLNHIGALKVFLQRRLAIPANELLLFYNGEILRDSYCMRDIDTSFGSNILFIDRRNRGSLHSR